MTQHFQIDLDKKITASSGLEKYIQLTKKAAKAAKRKRHGKEAAFDQIETILAERKKISQHKILQLLLAKIETDLTPNEITLTGWCLLLSHGIYKSISLYQLHSLSPSFTTSSDIFASTYITNKNQPNNHQEPRTKRKF
ncbi:hypothetical protein YC2023_031387 [Brassica napus]